MPSELSPRVVRQQVPVDWWRPTPGGGYQNAEGAGPQRAHPDVYTGRPRPSPRTQRLWRVGGPVRIPSGPDRPTRGRRERRASLCRARLLHRGSLSPRQAELGRRDPRSTSSRTRRYPPGSAPVQCSGLERRDHSLQRHGHGVRAVRELATVDAAPGRGGTRRRVGGSKSERGRSTARRARRESEGESDQADSRHDFPPSLARVGARAGLSTWGRWSIAWPTRRCHGRVA